MPQIGFQCVNLLQIGLLDWVRLIELILVIEIGLHFRLYCLILIHFGVHVGCQVLSIS